MNDSTSPLQRARLEYRPGVPAALRRGIRAVGLVEVGTGDAGGDAVEIRERFATTHGRPALELVDGAGPEAIRPLRVGVVLSGGQAPGGHNVITGLFDAIRGAHPESRLFGFLGGPRGIFTSRHRELTAEELAGFRNTGGFDLIGGGRDKIETDAQFQACEATCDALNLDGLVVVGGDDSNTNAAALAEFLLSRGRTTAVVGAPKTIDGDMKGGGIETSFGFDTATKVYSELVGNICRDAKSAGKYWHVIKLMGRSASHVALECALQCRVNVALIGEEVADRGLTLAQVVGQVADVVRRRAEAGRDYGVCLVPEGLIEFIPEIRALIAELNEIVHENDGRLGALSDPAERRDLVRRELSAGAAEAFAGLPARIQDQLLLERDAHGNVQVSRIDTESLLVEKVASRISRWKADGRFPGRFQVQHHFFGYEGRCAAPSNFDADYAYSLGQVAATLVAFGRTGYICAVRNLAGPRDRWRAAAIPLTSLLRIETRKGRRVPVIGKAVVRTDAEPFLTFAAARRDREIEDRYRYPGAIQYFGPDDVSGRSTRTVELEYPPA